MYPPTFTKCFNLLYQISVPFSFLHDRRYADNVSCCRICQYNIRADIPIYLFCCVRMVSLQLVFQCGKKNKNEMDASLSITYHRLVLPLRLGLVPLTGTGFAVRCQVPLLPASHRINLGPALLSSSVLCRDQRIHVPITLLSRVSSCTLIEIYTHSDHPHCRRRSLTP